MLAWLGDGLMSLIEWLQISESRVSATSFAGGTVKT